VADCIVQLHCQTLHQAYSESRDQPLPVVSSKSTLEKLLAKVEAPEGFEDEEERLKVYRELLKPVLRSVGDPLEKCRELAVKVLQRYVRRPGLV
jgi:hypothetical protein